MRIRLFGGSVLLWIALGVAALAAGAQTAQPWPPILPEDLALKDSPLGVGEPAAILFYEVQTDSVKSTETTYLRIKIFREEGRKYANVEIPYFETFTQVEEIRARVTSPEGKSEEFTGTVYDKEVVRMKKFRWSMKTFALPNVQLGSIIEYSYRLHDPHKIPEVFRNPFKYIVDGGLAYPAAQWEIQRSLSILHAHFVLHPIKGAKTTNYSYQVPVDAAKTIQPDGSLDIAVSNIPAYQEEEYSPPAQNLKARVEMYYVAGNTDYFWSSVSKWEAKRYEEFIGKPKVVKQEVDRILSPGDSEETKLRKIYARVQQIRALTYEPEKSKKERKQESLKENKNAEDVLSHGYAAGNEMNLVFIALARAVGIQAFPVRLASRNRAFFTQERLDPNQLDSMVVEVRSGSQQIFLDPATIYCPYGLLPWEETGAGGVRIDSVEGKVEFTPKPESKDAVTRRSANLKLDAQGNLEGNLTITYEGQEALTRRLKAIDEDQTQRRKGLEEAVQNSLPHGATVKLLSSEGWTSSETPLKVRFNIQVPNYANTAGQRLVFPLAVFHTNGQNPFATANRIHAVYFDYPAEVYEEAIIELPAGIGVESLPANQKVESGVTRYELDFVKGDNSMQVKRQFRMASFYIPVERYPALRRFYDNVRTNDEQQAVLRTVPSISKN
jgi:hypothetical protein